MQINRGFRTESQNHPDDQFLKNCYRTCDLYLAAFLKAKGIYLRRTTRQGGRVYFYFERDGNLEKFIQSYLNNGSIGALGYKAVILDCARFRILRPIIPKQKKWLSLRSRRKVTRLDLRG